MPVDDNASEAADGGVPAKRPKHKESQKADGKKRGFGPPAAGYVCKACNQPGHWLELCPRYEEYKAGPPPPGYVCARCSQAGHWVHNCAAATGKYREHSAARPQEEVGPDVVVSADARDVGAELAENLEEDAPEVVALLCKCVQLLGEAEARQLVVQTWQTENAGGLLTQDGSNRRRTPGGVFLWLVKQKLSSVDRARLFRRPA